MESFEGPDRSELRQGLGRVFTSSTRTRLDHVSAADYDFLFTLALDAGPSWSWGGTPATAENFSISLWKGVTEQAMVRARDGRPLGLVSLYGYKGLHRTGFLRAYLAPHARLLGWPLEAVALFVDLCFTRYDLRVLYTEQSSARLQQFSRLKLDLFQEEARLRDSLMIDGELQDFIVLAAHRATWNEHRKAILTAINAS